MLVSSAAALDAFRSAEITRRAVSPSSGDAAAPDGGIGSTAAKCASHGHAGQGGLVERQARAAGRLQEQGRVGGRGEGAENLAIGAGNARKSPAGGEAGGDRVADVDDAIANGQAAGQDALMHEEERVTRASKFEENFAGERRARGKL